MSYQQGVPVNDPLAAALAAAAALARNGSFLFDAPAATPASSSDHGMVAPSISPPVGARSFSPPEPVTSRGSNGGVFPDGEKSKNKKNSDSRLGNNGNENENENETSIDTEEDAMRRMARSRERNREHARRTRKRKKAQLEALQTKVHSLQAENKSLTQSLEKCRIASILVGFSVSDGDDRDGTIQSLLKEASDIEGKDIFKRLMGGKRTRFVSDASDIGGNAGAVSPPGVASSGVSVPLTIVINGRSTIIGGDGQSHLNWKTGVYTDENGLRSLLTNQQLESLRRERNRMHAKMTRDRKKTFIAAIEQTIEELESSNKRMNDFLADVICNQKPSPSIETPICTSSAEQNSRSSSRSSNYETVSDDDKLLSSPPPGVTPNCSPAIAPRKKLAVSVPELMPALLEASSSSNNQIHTVMLPVEDERESQAMHLPPKKRVCHGFFLPY